MKECSLAVVKDCASVLAVGLVSLNLVAFSPISANSDINNVIVSEGECDGVYITAYEVSEKSCESIDTYTGSVSASITSVPLKEDALASL